MAPTGRAAMILRSKTNYGSTIHKSIYKLDNVEFSSEVIELAKEDKDESYKLIFPIDKLEKSNTLLIIDEASMISSRKSEHPVFQFGTDVLMQDIITYSQVHILNTKLIFVGDTAQLPPVGDNKSWAFEPSLFEKKDMSVIEVELKEVKRQTDNLILKNASLIREKINEVNPKELAFSYDESSFIHLKSDELFFKFIEENPIPEMNSSVIIAYSNAQCYHFNNAVREKYFPGIKDVYSGDILQIISNNYKTYPIELYNGDFAKVLAVYRDSRTISPLVYVEENGKRFQKNISLTFRKIQILLNNYDEPFDCMIIESLLNSTHRDLTISESKAIYIDFIIRFDEIQNKKKLQGVPYAKRYSTEFKEMMMHDPYMNAIRCKYGYAITCHKSQGGEWKKVFVDYSGRVSLKEDPLRWCYTATTRGVDTCYAINPPHFTRFSKFEIKPIGQISNIPTEAYRFENIDISPFHNEGHHLCKSQKYWDVLEQIEGMTYEIKSVFSSDYLERYNITKGNANIEIEGYHKKSGVFEMGFKVITSNCDQETKNELENIFNHSTSTNYNLKYSPSMEILSRLYSIMQELCAEAEVIITNIVENSSHNYVNYFLKTDSVCSYIQFYYNKDEQLTVALPRTYKCPSDVKFQQLISKLKDYAI
jgi:hypothetical protein